MKTIRYQQYHVTLSKNTFTSVNYGIICALNVTRPRSISCLTFFSPGKTIFHDLCNNLSSDVSRFELYRLLAGTCDRCYITWYTFLILSKLIKYYTYSIVCFHQEYYNNSSSIWGSSNNVKHYFFCLLILMRFISVPCISQHVSYFP